MGGQKTLRSYWRNYFEATDGLVWVVDAADARRMADTAAELHKLLQEERLAGATLLVLANKQDVAGAVGAEAAQAALRLGDLGSRHWRVVGCSGATGEGLDEAFGWLVGDIASRIFLLE